MFVGSLNFLFVYPSVFYVTTDRYIRLIMKIPFLMPNYTNF